MTTPAAIDSWLLPDWAAGLQTDAIATLHELAGWGGLRHRAYTAAGLLFNFPLVMAYVWMISAIIFYLRWEVGRGNPVGNLLKLTSYPPISILVPCYNEGQNVCKTIAHALAQDYPDFEVIAINDGSCDDTLDILCELAVAHPQLRIMNLATNQGKAKGLRAAPSLAAR